MRVCQHWHKLRSMDAPGAWIHRVAINLAISGARRRRTEGRTEARLAAERPRDPVATTDGDDPVSSAVAALPPAERAVLVLRFYADLSVADTACVLHIPEGTVKTRTRRALATLRSHDLILDNEEVAS